MRFLADMGISMHTVEEILAKARDEERIVLTMDLDFGYLLASGRERMPSVVLFRLHDERSEMVNLRLAEVLSKCQSDLEAGAIVSVSERSIRIRTLPVQ